MDQKTNSTRKGGAFSGAAVNSLFWFLTLTYMETLLHILLFGGFSTAYFYALGFTAVFALAVSGLLGLLPTKANKAVSIALVSILSILFCSQIVYDAVFGTMYSVALVALGGGAFTSFWRETLLTIWEHLPVLLLMLAPIPVTAVLAAKCKPVFSTRRDWLKAGQLALALVLHLAVYLCLSIGGTGDYSTYYFYHSSDTTTNQCAERFGLLTTMRLEICGNSDSSGDESSFSGFTGSFDVGQPSASDAAVSDSSVSGSDAVSTPVEYNILEIDFDHLNTLTTDKQLLELNAYVQSLSGTNKNEYTGMLADYNLITICAESFSTGAIHPEITPTLYKLANEGIVFNNYYDSYPNVTTDGEYSFCFGLWPDISRSREASSFYASRNSYLPFALGNVFKDQAGVQSYFYHNYQGSYYGRDETHPNMGYECKFAQDGMYFTTDWPSSDYEMMQQSIGDYISSEEQFHAYYMTFSGHFKYSAMVNPMASRNYEQVRHLDLSEEAKCYLSCHYELEKALVYLMEELEKAGVADKTAIVIAGDHFPYGLTDQQYSELVGYPLDDFSKYKSSLIFWVGGLEEPIVVDEYTCNNDILPTILNLWGFSYDSRLLSGVDVFSDAEHIAILRDQSFLTDRVWFNASTGEAIWLNGDEDADQEYLNRLINKVKNQFTAAGLILSEAYYNFLFEKGNVTVTLDYWEDFGGGNDDAQTEETPDEPPAETPEADDGNTEAPAPDPEPAPDPGNTDAPADTPAPETE